MLFQNAAIKNAPHNRRKLRIHLYVSICLSVYFSFTTN